MAVGTNTITMNDTALANAAIISTLGNGTDAVFAGTASQYTVTADSSGITVTGNLHALPTLGGFRYRPHLSELWATAFDAYRMEQAVLRTFDTLRHPSNREVLFSLRRDDLERSWRTCIVKIQEGTSAPPIAEGMTRA